MSPKADSSSDDRRASSASPPYPPPPARRTSSKPKSARQQFSACGACRMRRVRCDLKDLQAAALDGQLIACSNCRERGLKCVDEFAQVKAVKLLRRGRRLQQVEAVYGKVQQSDSHPMNLLAGHTIAVSQTSLCAIPKLKPEFFSSPFFRAFSMQRPILDPLEFTSRYFEYSKGNPDALGTAGQLIAMVLVVWANSFGLDEAGNPMESEAPLLSPSLPHATNNSASASGHASERSSASPGAEAPGGNLYLNTDDLSLRGIEQRYDAIRRRKDRTNDMLREILRLIDVCGILRKPSWDGVRVLLLVLPLTVDMQPPMERLTMYESTLSQIYTLCSLSPPAPVHSGQGEYIDALVRARIFWYAYAHEGITTGLKGGRLYLSEDDLDAFQATLPPLPLSTHSPSSTPHSPTMPSPPPLTRTSLTYTVHYHYGAVPLRVSNACRLVHAALTGPRARQRGEIDESSVREAWEMLDTAWEELETLKSPTAGSMGVLSRDEVLRFVYGWQIYIFECHNVIREALKQRLVALSSSSSGSGYPSSSSLQYDKAGRLHTLATQKCHYLVRSVVQIMKNNLGTTFFEYDAGIVRDGCFFAGFIMAGEGQGSDEDVEVCLRALKEMRWALCKSEEREQNVKLVWEGKQARAGLPSAQQLFESSRTAFGSAPQSPFGSPPYALYTANGVPPQLPSIQAVSSMPPSPGHRFRQSSATSADGSWPIPASNRSDTSSPRPMSSHSSFLSSSSQTLTGSSVSLSDGVSGMASMSIPRSTAYYSRAGDVGSQSHQLYYPSNDLSQYNYTASSGSSTLPSRHPASVLTTPAGGSSGPLSTTAGVYQQHQNRYFDPTAAPPVYSSSATSFPDVWQ
ncbi:hypothetical protein GLOTRDRAFT_120144 [Gloeophyllum trabeum ATCC 11539]|uniref:Zn(2)-C6 fungal-type domain-containing protein n=1 Tax=Gloeophyllum trabeum (strain ATCC 11539 / FP-39264 / Madison 617) TaxID=670483 RepID=S7QG41_GLOTA|nr:uncharacterized protein GLOTRDRAFT_120144 [Gloeophyllum trabeum ATCC 11539]EPQ58392.1 hypothetical protein GLOTRDRAFT_120144 [Gloeophyllum trabeum ATCC 11539]